MDASTCQGWERLDCHRMVFNFTSFEVVEIRETPFYNAELSQPLDFRSQTTKLGNMGPSTIQNRTKMPLSPFQ